MCAKYAGVEITRTNTVYLTSHRKYKEHFRYPLVLPHSHMNCDRIQSALVWCMLVFSCGSVPDKWNLRFDFSMARRPLMGQGVLIVEAARLHTDKPHSVGLHWRTDRPVAKTSTRQHTTLIRQTSMPPAVFEPTVPANKRPQTHVLDRATSGIGWNLRLLSDNSLHTSATDSLH